MLNTAIARHGSSSKVLFAAGLAAIAMALSLGGCGALNRSAHADSSAQKRESEASVGLLKGMLVGSFSSAEQAAQDPEYRDIRLHMTEIWRERNDGPWLYVEQAMAGMPPYRQRVYRLSQLSGTMFQSAIYELPGSFEDVVKNFAGAWKEPRLLANLSPRDLVQRDGCEVVLKYDASTRSFRGSTLGANCPSSLRGSTYATSIITLQDGVLVSWDRGFDARNEYVWGATKGGYRFVRQPDGQ